MIGKTDGLRQSTSQIMASLNGLPESSMEMWIRTKVSGVVEMLVCTILASLVVVAPSSGNVVCPFDNFCQTNVFPRLLCIPTF